MKIHFAENKGIISISSGDALVGIANAAFSGEDNDSFEALFLSDIYFSGDVHFPRDGSVFLTKPQEILLKLLAISEGEDLPEGSAYLKKGKLLRLSNMRIFPAAAGGSSALEPNFVIEVPGEKLFYAGSSLAAVQDVPDDCANILFNGKVFYPDGRYVIRSRLQEILKASDDIVFLPVSNMDPLLLTTALEAADTSSRIPVVDLLTYLFLGLLNKHSLSNKYNLPGNVRIKFDKQQIDVLEAYGYGPFIQSCGKMKIDQYDIKRKRKNILFLLSNILPLYDVLKEKNIGSIRGAVSVKIQGSDNRIESILAEKGVVSSEVNIQMFELSSRTLSLLAGRKVITTSSNMGEFFKKASNDTDVLTLTPGGSIDI